ncbi:pyrimidine 5'-nucleotidase [Azonexus sp.]|uniref:pyrimidine 5'-nucleotidase n=1 Tax=Azonexus sp. TaxID=1872668 RepID=UPI0039E43337
MYGERVWLFDLDNTLHDASPHIFPRINHAMRDYIAQHLALDTASADRLRQDYWQRYGATLLGLTRHHAIDPAHFLRETHRFPDLERLIAFEKPVRQTLKRLPGRKLLFTNAPLAYAQAVLNLTGLEVHFSAIYSVEHLDFQPKPMLAAYRRLLRAERLSPRRCIMVEDSLANLVTAKALGMKTVWVSASLRDSPSADIKIRSVRELPRHLARL